MAAALQGISLKESAQRAEMNKKECFKCGKRGHLQKNCPQNDTSGNNRNRSIPPFLCPKCKWGKHWANECLSRTYKDGGNPLVNNISGNGRRGQPQAPQEIYGAMTLLPQQPVWDISTLWRATPGNAGLDLSVSKHKILTLDMGPGPPCRSFWASTTQHVCITLGTR